jgi:phosphopantetheine adenylyltransferase
LANKQYKEWLEPFEQRKAHLEAFLHTLNPSLELYIARLVDVAGPAGTDVDLQAIVVSEETAKGADTINSGRQASGLSTLASWCIPVIEAPAALLAVRHDVKISSTTLRKRAADRAAAAAAAATTPQ